MKVILTPVPRFQTGALKNFESEQFFLNRIVFSDEFFFHVNVNVNKVNEKI